MLPAAPDDVRICIERIERNPDSHPVVRSLAAYVRAGGSKPDLSAFWRSTQGAQFFKVFAGVFRPDFWREVRQLIPVLARYGANGDLIGLDRATRDVGASWP
jgi:hypothetical protein